MSKKIGAQLGHEFEVKLQGMPTAGYEWGIQSGEENVEVVRLENEAPSMAIGAESVQRFILKPRKAGDFVLQFGLKRPWESRSTSVESIQVHVAGKTAKAKKVPANKSVAKTKKKTAKKTSPKRTK